jgi:hypothetical protein
MGRVDWSVKLVASSLITHNTMYDQASSSEQVYGKGIVYCHWSFGDDKDGHVSCYRIYGVLFLNRVSSVQGAFLQ